jgi:hypothetical protein
MAKEFQGNLVEDFTEPHSMQPGDYSKHPYQRDGLWWPGKPFYYACTPNGYACNLQNHTIEEHEDGTITASPSILVGAAYDGGQITATFWHGYLIKGVWREC